MPGRVERWAGALAVLLAASAMPAAPAAAAEPAPDADLLEFLGLLVEDDGEYLDPLDLMDVALPDGQLDPQAPAAGGVEERNEQEH